MYRQPAAENQQKRRKTVLRVMATVARRAGLAGCACVSGAVCVFWCLHFVLGFRFYRGFFSVLSDKSQDLVAVVKSVTCLYVCFTPGRWLVQARDRGFTHLFSRVGGVGTL